MDQDYEDLNEVEEQNPCEEDAPAKIEGIPDEPEPEDGVTEVCHIAHFWESYGRCAMHFSPMG